MNKAVWSLVAVLISGCSAFGIDKQADNRTWITVTCSGFGGWDACKEQAQRACRKGYDVANQEENAVTLKRTMQYACK